MKKSIIEFIDVLSSDKKEKKSGEIYIISIAIDDYDVELKLNHSIRDSEYLIDICMKKSFINIKSKNIYKLYNKNATKNNIISNFRRLNNILTSKDQLIIHIAGHSHISFETNLFVPVDGNKSDIFTNITNLYIKEFISKTNYDNCIVIFNTFNKSNIHQIIDKPDDETVATTEIRSKLSLYSDLIQFLEISEKYVNKSIWHYANTKRTNISNNEQFVIVDDSRKLHDHLDNVKEEFDNLLENGRYTEALQRIIRISNNNENKIRDQADALLAYIESKRHRRELVKPIEPLETKGLTASLVHQIHESGYYLIPKNNLLIEPREKSKAKIILYASADTSDQVRLRLDEEYRVINLELLRSKFRDDYELVPCLSSRITDLQRELLEKSPFIVHFTGHGSCKGICMIADDSGITQLIENEPLGGLFNLFRDTINCVFLNSCYSVNQSVEISKSIDNVICMSSAIKDETAIKFASAFYMSLGSGKDIEFCFNFAKNSIDLQGCTDKNLPTHIKNGTV